MKKPILLLLISIGIFTGCNSHKKGKWVKQNDGQKAVKVSAQNDQTISDTTSTASTDTLSQMNAWDTGYSYPRYSNEGGQWGPGSGSSYAGSYYAQEKLKNKGKPYNPNPTPVYGDQSNFQQTSDTLSVQDQEMNNGWSDEETNQEENNNNISE